MDFGQDGQFSMLPPSPSMGYSSEPGSPSHSSSQLRVSPVKHNVATMTDDDDMMAQYDSFFGSSSPPLNPFGGLDDPLLGDQSRLLQSTHPMYAFEDAAYGGSVSEPRNTTVTMQEVRADPAMDIERSMMQELGNMSGMEGLSGPDNAERVQALGARLDQEHRMHQQQHQQQHHHHHHQHQQQQQHRQQEQSQLAHQDARQRQHHQHRPLQHQHHQRRPEQHAEAQRTRSDGVGGVRGAGVLHMDVQRASGIPSGRDAPATSGAVASNGRAGIAQAARTVGASNPSGSSSSPLYASQKQHAVQQILQQVARIKNAARAHMVGAPLTQQESTELVHATEQIQHFSRALSQPPPPAMEGATVQMGSGVAGVLYFGTGKDVGEKRPREGGAKSNNRKRRKENPG